MQDCSGDYVGKIRNTEKKKFVVYEQAGKGGMSDSAADAKVADAARKQVRWVEPG